MIRAIECEEYRDEAKAILSWFRVVSHAERAITLNRLRETLSIDPYRITLSTNQKQRWFEHWSKYDSTPIDVKGWMAKHGEKNIAENPNNFMEVMIQASQHRKLREETDATMAWFTLLPSTERAVALLRLRECLSSDLDRLILSLDPIHQDEEDKHRTSSQKSGNTHQHAVIEFQPSPWDEFSRRLKYDYSPIFKRSTKPSEATKPGKLKRSKEEVIGELRQFSQQFQLPLKERADSPATGVPYP